MAKALKVTFFGNSGTDPFLSDLITGFSGARFAGLADRNPADVASSRNFCDNPLCGLFGGAMICGKVERVMYLQRIKKKMKINIVIDIFNQ